MANLIRSAKSGSDWNLNDLYSYHISLNQMDALSFFGLQLPQPSVDPELLINADAGAMQQDRHAELITYLDFAMIPYSEKGETNVVDFTVELFRNLGYVRRERVACTRMDLPFLICGENRHVEIDVCIFDRSQNDIRLVVQEDKQLEHEAPVNARAQFVAEAVGAFNENNAQRKEIGLPPMVEKVIPGIVMAGTSPAFFQIPTPKLCPVIFTMGPILRKKPALPIVIRPFLVLLPCATKE